MVALLDGQPHCLQLRDFLRHFLDWRCDVITRRSAFHASE
jgi:DNA gyrase/topoisomerase IV subunit A